MKKLLEKIRRILRNRRIRRLLARVVSVTAALVVFVTTYALVLPAITMETNALCGIEAHEHTDECYTEELICGLEESPGHMHDETCYEISQVQVCQVEEHRHDQSCYDDEGNLVCSLQEHRHTDDCFEEHKELICQIPESEGHTHTAECYQKMLTCGKEVHIHSTECYEEETDDPEDVYEEEEYSDDMTMDEADGMEEDEAEDSWTDMDDEDQDSRYDSEDGEDFGEDSYTESETDDEDDDSTLNNEDEVETVETMDDEISVEDGDSPDDDLEDISDNAGQEDEEEDGQEPDQEDGGEGGQEGGEEAGQEPDQEDGGEGGEEVGQEGGEEVGQEAGEETGEKDTDKNADDASSKETEEGTDAAEKAEQTDAEDADAASTDKKDADAASTDKKDADAASTDKKDADAAEKAGDAYEPELKPVNFEAVLNKNTGIYYHHVAEGETVEDSSVITDWSRVEEDTELGKSDLLRVYLSYTIPSGTLNGTNPTARYRLPENIRLSDAQIEAINRAENGIAAAYTDSEEDYQKYLGMEAVEGGRKPDEKLKDDAQEFISATVRAENIYDGDGQKGEAGAYPGQELIFTFAPYTIEKNRNIYDAEHKIVSAGEEITGWFVCDLNTEQVEWSEETVIRETELPEDFPEDLSEGLSEGLSEELSEGDREDDPGTIEDVSEDSGKNRDQAAPEGVSENSGDNRDQKAPKDTPEESRDTQDQDISEESPDKQDQDASEENQKNDQGHQGTPEENQKNSRDEQDAPEDIQDNSETIQENVEKGLNEDGNYTGPEPDSNQTEPEPDSNQTGAEPDGNHTATIIVTVEKTAEIIFAAENKEESIKEISSRLRLVDQKEVERVIDEDGAAGSEDTAVTASEDEKSKDASDVEKEASDSEKDHADAEKDGAEGASDKEKAPSEKEENTVDKKEEDKQTFKPGTLISEGDGYRITLDYTEEAQIPDSAELSVREITAETDKEAYEQCLAQAKAHVGKEGKENTDVDTSMSRFFDIEILVKNEKSDDNASGGNGMMKKLEPAAPVKVSIQILDTPVAASQQTPQSDPTVLHFAEEGVEQIDATAITEETVAETGRTSNASGSAAGTGKKSAEKAGMASGSNAAGTGKESGKGSKEKNGTASGTSGADKESSAVPDTSSEGGKTTEVRFEAESFSIYGLVYTVDFLWEVNGKSYKFNIPGGGFVSFSKLFEAMGIASGKEINSDVIDLNDILASDNMEEISEETRSFVAGIEKMEFSRPELLWVGQAEEGTTVSNLRVRLSLDAEYSASVKPEEIDKINETEIEKGDWVLLSVKAFETQETLTVTMKDGEIFTILVTDEQNAIMNPDGQTVQTIPNPSGTTIDMFDYWIDNETEVARRGWLGYRRRGTTGYDSSFWNYFDDQNTNTNGNNVGINRNHRLKFLPSMGGQVQDWETNGTYHATSLDGRIAGINSWNGKNENNTNYYNGAPTTGIIANALYNSSGALDPDGYPRLNSSLGGESLNYLFDPATGHSGKRSYTRANNLFYVDPDGYYTYDSMDYSASMNKSTKQFTLREQPTNDNRAGIRGFWPMGDLNYWLGMHLKAEFSMPQNGEVLNPKGVYKPMEFQFSGDDDAWAYIDGILVADGGGIHNRTELDIDFKTGIVKVIGGTYTDLSNPDMTVVSERTLYQIFSQAHSNGLISNDKWNSYEWADYDGDGTPDTFAQGTNLTFDFFYLERGGGESNLYIHYNLISTTDFSAHKSYHMLQNDPNARLQRDQFKFELIGFDEPGNEGETIYAVMPDKGAPGGDGSFESPQKVHSDSGPGGAGVPDGMTAHTSLIIGVTEDGNVNFGDVEISSAYEGKEYKYMVREVVPDDAVNADGVRWDAADESLKAEGGFIKDGITYDGKIYYFKGKVYETESGKYELKKTRYTDSTYTEIDDQTKFFSFVNGYVRPLTFKVLKRNETGETPLDGAQFTLTRAMQDQDGKWVVRTYQNGGETIEAASRSGTTSNGEVSFNNLTEGHFILEETAAPSGYEKGDPCRWLLTLTKQDSDTEILLIPTIQGLSSDGTLIGAPRTLDTDANNVAEYQILNQPKLIQLTLTKEWVGGAPDNSEASFQLKRYRTYTKPGEVTMVDVYIRYAGDFQSYADNGCNTGKHLRVPANSRVRFGYSGFNAGYNNYVYPWLTEYVGGSGGGHREALVNGRYDATYTIGTQEVCFWLFANHGNISPTDGRFNFTLEYVNGTGDTVGPSQLVTEEDPTFTAENITVTLPHEGNWNHTFASYPAVGINSTYNVSESYTYYIEEIPPYIDGYEIIYDRMNGNDIAGSSDSENRVITNRKKTEVPVNKTWKWSEEDEGRAVSWDATFVLEYRETLVSGEPASDAQHTWAAVSGAASKTIHKGDTGDAITFRDLPMYREHSNGSVYRIIYAVDEIAYHVYDSSDHLIARWTKDGSESQIGTLYAPDYEQDAGELDQPEDYADWPAWYTISLMNIVHETKVTNTIDLGIRKIWEDESIQNTDGAYAKFQLKRYVHEEYRDFSKEGIDTSQPVTVTLDLGEGRQTQITVPKGAPVHISGMAKPEHSVELTFTKPDSTSLIMQLDNSESVRQAVADTESFNPQSDCTISFAHGNTDAIIGGLDGLRLACYYDRQTPQIDTSFNTEHDGYLDPSGQVFTLSNANHWQKEWVELPQIVEGKLNGDLQTVYVYSYFLEETESYPEGYVSIFKNSAGEELGDRYIPVDFNTTITAENVETTAVTVRKVWDDDNNEDRPESLTITLLSDGTRTDKTVTLNEANNWEDSIGDLPKYNDGVAIDYEWIEEEMPSGYFLTNISTSEGENGTITTLTNSLSKYDIKTSYIGVKNWDDVNNQYLTRPHELAVSLYADGQLTGHTAEWTEGPQENQWTYIFRDLPVFTETGEIIQYTAEEEPVPGGYTESHTATNTDGQIGTITYDTGSNRITLDDQQNKQIVWTLGSVIDLAFIAIKPKANGDVFVWTSRTPVPGEVTAITNEIRSGAIPGVANRNIYFSSGIGDVTTPQGSVHVTFDEAELRVVLDFGSTKVWNHFIVGQFNGNDSSNYEPGTTTFTNSLRTTSLSGSKTWAIPADTEHPDPVLKLTRTTTGIDIDGTPIVSDPEVVQIKVGNDMVNLQPQWSGDGATMRSFTYNDLPQFDPAGKEYTYSVEEVSFTIGSGEDTVVYTVVKNPDGRTYTVTSDPADAEVFVVTQDGNSITNSPLQVSIDIIKVEKGHKDSSHTLSGAKFRLLRVNENNDNNYAGEGSYQSEKTVDPETGTVTFEGLKPGRYKLEETESPDGYILVETPWFITVDRTGAAHLEASYSMASPAGDNSFYIENESGALLPSSGGPGTKLFTILGSILIVGTALLLWIRRITRITRITL